MYRITHTNYTNLSVKGLQYTTNSQKIIHFPYKSLSVLNYNNKHPHKLHVSLEQYYKKRNVTSKPQNIVLRKYEHVRISHIMNLKAHDIDFIKVYKRVSLAVISAPLFDLFNSHIHSWLETYAVAYSHVKSNYRNLNKFFRSALEELNNKDIVVIIGKYITKNRILKYFLSLFENITFKKIRINSNSTIIVGINSVSKSVLLIFKCDIESSIIGWYCFLEPYIRDILRMRRKKDCFSVLLNNFSNFTNSSCVLRGKTYISKNNRLVTVVLKDQNFKFLDSLIHCNSFITVTPDKKIYKKGELIKIFIV
jgi:molybdopterin biosynthesis enzyme